MRRFWCVPLVLILALSAEGCRRSASVKKPPIDVSLERDFVYAVNPNQVVGDLKALPPPPPDVKVDPKVAEMIAKAKEFAAQQKRVDDTAALGQEFMNFRNQTKVIDQDLDRFRLYLRRNEKFDLYDAVTANKMELIFLSLPNAPQHLSARHKTENEGFLPVFQGGLPILLMKPEAYADRLQNQEIFVVWWYAMEYTMPHFHSAPDALFKQIRGVNTPAKTLAVLGQKFPQQQYLKNPPEPRSFAKFKRYLKDNAAPDVLKAVEAKSIRVNLDVDLYNDNDLMVCQAKTDPKTKGHRTIYASGVVYNDVSPILIELKFK